MRKISFIVYGLWIAAGLVLKIYGLVSWFVALSWLWFPLAMLVVVITFLNLSAVIGRKIKEKEDAKIPDSCEVCLFGQSAGYAENGKCLGCTLNPEWEFGHVCEFYNRNIIHK